jgi:diguanylate cyclase (GGDEF)-like protein/PAS domain S-box-containing protein/putative nucleotidyltransferase with HDIG domain
VPGQGPTPEEIGAAVRSRGLFEAEIAMVRKSGEAFPALLTITPLHAPDGRLEGYVGIIKDITALKAVQDALRRERDFIRGVIETSELCIIGLSLPDECVTMFNRGAEMITGYRRDEIIGRPGSPALLSAEIADKLRRDVAQEADKAGGVCRFESALRTRSGQEKALSWTYTVAKDEQGRPTHLVAFGFDLTETRQMQASLEKAKADLEKANAELERIANTDYLTGLVNRRQMTLLLEHEWAWSRRNDKPLSVILLDIDRFKAVNDTHGHEAGDAALKHMANVLRGRVRASDIIVRYGGEEFILVLPETDLNGASGLAESLRRIVQESPAAYGDMRIALSSSLGVATIEPGQNFSAETLIRMADEAMYCAKSLGGNRVVIWNRVHEGQVEPALMASPEAQDLQKRIETIARRNDATVLESLYEFARGLEAPNPYTDRHSCNVTEYAVAMAREMGLGSTEVETIRRSGMLHDIGRAAIPAAAIWKSGPLSKSDWALVCQHPVVSAKMVERLPFLRREAGIVRHHHERPDGRGYPDSLHGDAIPLEARVVAVADALDAITRDRPHRPARSLEDALGELHAGAPSQFDPRVVAAAQAAAKKAEGWPLARPAEPATVSPAAT